MSQKGLAPILIILLIALAIGGYFVYNRLGYSLPKEVYTNYSNSRTKITPAPTDAGETANWKTYTDRNHGFIIKYPKKLNQSIREYPNTYPYNINSNPKNSPIREVWLTYTPKDSLEFIDAVVLRIFEAEQVSIDDLKSGKVISFQFQNNQWKELEIGGYKGFYTEVVGEAGPQGGIIAVLDTPKAKFLIQHTNTEDKQYITNEEFTQILSTFKFLDQ